MLQMANENKNAPLKPVDLSEFPKPTYEEWKEQAVASLKGAPFEKKLLTKTYEGITLEPLYTAAHAEKYPKQQSLPGFEDYLRGIYAGGYLEEAWKIAQNVAGTPAEANALLKQELAKGATAISFDYDEVKLKDAADLEALLDGICLLENPLNVYAGAEAKTMLDMLWARIQNKGYKEYDYKGCVGADPIGEYARWGCAGCKDELPKLAECLKFTKANMPQLKTIFINGTVYSYAGANAIQEVAAAMATAVYYIEYLTEQGFSVDEVAKSIRFRFALGANFFMEIAKLRAARTIWAQIVKAYGGSDEAGKIDIAAQTSEFTQTVYDPYVNILRATTQTFSGVVGGVSELTVHPFDKAIRPADELARRVARNIQVMMQTEFGLMAPADPAGGSWYVETLTGQVAEAIWAKLQEIQAKGGILAVLEDGSLYDEVEAVLQERFKKLAFRTDKAVGSNMYPNMTEVPLEGACDKACTCCCDEVKPAIKAFAPHRWTEQFEALRKATEDYVAKTGKNVKVFLCNMGPIPQHKARADFAGTFMEVAKFEVLRNDGFATTDDAIAAAKASGADVAIICSTDDTYPELVPVLAKGIKAAAPGMKVMLAGAAPAELKAEWDAAGVDEYVNVKSNCLAILSNIQKERGIC